MSLALRSPPKRRDPVSARSWLSELPRWAEPPNPGRRASPGSGLAGSPAERCRGRWRGSTRLWVGEVNQVRPVRDLARRNEGDDPP